MYHFMNEHIPKRLLCPVNVTSQPDAVLTFAVLSRREHITAKATQFNNGELAPGQHRAEIQPVVLVKTHLQVFLCYLHIVDEFVSLAGWCPEESGQ